MSFSQTENLRVVIVGAGCSGSLVATHLLRQAHSVHLDIVDLRASGRGLAYSTAWDQHLLNVRAGRMSAFGSEPNHFLEWLGKNGHPEATTDSFVPRKVFGSYIQDLLESAIRAASTKDRLRHHWSTAVGLLHDGTTARVFLANGERITADRVVLALGNPAPCPLEAVGERYHNTPWERGALTGVPSKAAVLLVGSGLTAVDAFLALDAQGHQGDIYCVSRRGKLPHVHTVYQSLLEPFEPVGITNARDFLHALRRRVAEA
ncbi:MAG TPA: FAD/NAD(P)-binding protein, partial [Bryobacteraceae bacterium]